MTSGSRGAWRGEKEHKAIQNGQITQLSLSSFSPFHITHAHTKLRAPLWLIYNWVTESRFLSCTTTLYKNVLLYRLVLITNNHQLIVDNCPRSSELAALTVAPRGAHATPNKLNKNNYKTIVLQHRLWNVGLLELGGLNPSTELYQSCKYLMRIVDRPNRQTHSLLLLTSEMSVFVDVLVLMCLLLACIGPNPFL